jgi:hypothetical protein
MVASIALARASRARDGFTRQPRANVSSAIHSLHLTLAARASDATRRRRE